MPGLYIRLANDHFIEPPARYPADKPGCPFQHFNGEWLRFDHHNKPDNLAAKLALIMSWSSSRIITSAFFDLAINGLPIFGGYILSFLPNIKIARIWCSSSTLSNFGSSVSRNRR